MRKPDFSFGLNEIWFAPEWVIQGSDRIKKNIIISDNDVLYVSNISRTGELLSWYQEAYKEWKKRIDREIDEMLTGSK